MSTTQGPAKAAPTNDDYVKEAIITLTSTRARTPGDKLRIVAALVDLLRYGDRAKTMEFIDSFLLPDNNRTIQTDLLLFAEVMDALMDAAEELGFNPDGLNSEEE